MQGVGQPGSGGVGKVGGAGQQLKREPATEELLGVGKMGAGLRAAAMCSGEGRILSASTAGHGGE